MFNIYVNIISRYHATVFAIAIFTMNIFTVVCANSGLAWAGASESEHGYGNTVQYSPNGDILASGHSSTVMISDAYTHENIQTLNVDFFVESVSFSNDARYLLVGMESILPDTPATVVFELNNNQYERRMHTEDGINVNEISVSHDDSTFATVTEDGNIIEWEINNGTGSSLNINRQYSSLHSGEITCLDHSTDGVHLLSGGQDGKIILWDRENRSLVDDWDNGSPVNDCKFSNDGTKISWIGGGSLIMRNNDLTHSYYGQYDISNDASQMSFTSDDDEVGLLVPKPDDNNQRRIDFVGIDTTPLIQSRTLLIAHKATSMSFHPTEQSIAISTTSSVVAYYSDSVPTELEIPIDIDSDQDNIPDVNDDDDDGDGIIDELDNICISQNECHLHPDLDYIRKYQINIDAKEVIIIESIHLDSIDSYHVRKLVSTSISDNSRVDNNEFLAFQESVCDEYNSSGFIVKWSNNILINDKPINPHTVQCSIDDGLLNTDDNDKRTRIKISWTVTSTMQNTVTTPYNVTIIAGMSNPTSTIAQNVHSFPITVEIYDVSGSSVTHDIWNRRDPNLNLDMDVYFEDESSIEKAYNILLEYWYVFAPLSIISVSMVVLFIIRRLNRISFDELEEDIEIPENEWQDIVDDAAAWDEIIDDETPRNQPKPPDAVLRDIRGKPSPPLAVKRDISTKKHKTKMTSVPKSNTKSKSESVEFMHLVTSSKKSNIDSDDTEITDAIAFLTTDKSDVPKRKRPVRKKKSTD